jgi:hypothetical protein
VDSLPVKRYFAVCVGMMGMQPSEFWNSSPIEVISAIEGFQEFHGVSSDKPLSRDELTDLMERYPD